MIQFGNLTTALQNATTVSQVVNALVDNRGYTFGDEYGSAMAGDEQGMSYPIHAGVLMKFESTAAVAATWPVHLITVTVDGGAHLGFMIGWPDADQSTRFVNAMNGTIAVASDDPLYPIIHRDTDESNEYARGMVIARLLGYDDYVMVKHQSTRIDDKRVVSSTGSVYKLSWIWDTAFSSNTITDHVHVSDGHALDTNGIRPFTSGQAGGGITTLHIDLCHALTDEQNFNDIAMTRAMLVKHVADANSAAVASNDSAIQSEAATRLSADRALAAAFESSTSFGTQVSTLVAMSNAVRQYIPRP